MIFDKLKKKFRHAFPWICFRCSLGKLSFLQFCQNQGSGTSTRSYFPKRNGKWTYQKPMMLKEKFQVSPEKSSKWPFLQSLKKNQSSAPRFVETSVTTQNQLDNARKAPFANTSDSTLQCTNPILEEHVLMFLLDLLVVKVRFLINW